MCKTYSFNFLLNVFLDLISLNSASKLFHITAPWRFSENFAKFVLLQPMCRFFADLVLYKWMFLFCIK